MIGLAGESLVPSARSEFDLQSDLRYSSCLHFNPDSARWLIGRQKSNILRNQISFRLSARWVSDETVRVVSVAYSTFLEEWKVGLTVPVTYSTLLEEWKVGLTVPVVCSTFLEEWKVGLTAPVAYIQYVP